MRNGFSSNAATPPKWDNINSNDNNNNNNNNNNNKIINT